MTAPSLFGDSSILEGPVADALAAAVSPTASSIAYAPTASLYRKYRPQSFDTDELVGQEHVIRTLRNAVSLNRVAHAYLFSGPRGTGKTTTARLLAKAVNCVHENPEQRPCNTCANCVAINSGSAPDIIEIDAASNRGIDDIRDLRERARYAPAQLPSKVYIIDEAHQITGAAANAFLKTLEEPPVHTRFILATTDPEELLPTIVSRCQRFEFRRLSANDVVRRLRTVADIENIVIDDDALRLIARHSTGSLRDALGLLEQLALQTTDEPDVSSPAVIDDRHVRTALGLSDTERIEQLVEAIGRRDAGGALRLVQDAIDQGEDPRQLNRQLMGYLRLLMLERSGGSGPNDDRVRALAAAFSLGELASLARRFGEIDFNIKHAPYPQLPLEVALVESAAPRAQPTLTEGQGHQDSEPATASVSRPTSLRDRVRGSSSIREVPPAQPVRSSRPEPLPITPLRADPPSEPVKNLSHLNDRELAVEHIADLWPSVRADVKALNRRIEALLSEVDPVAITGNQITLAVPYPFHRDKLNSDEVRDTVSGVLSRLLDRDITLLCVLRGEMTTPVSAATVPIELEPPAVNDASAGSPDEAERARIRLRAAINIFDAEQVIDAVAPNQPTSGDSG